MWNNNTMVTQNTVTHMLWANNDLILQAKQWSILKIFQNPNKVKSTSLGLNVLKGGVCNVIHSPGTLWYSLGPGAVAILILWLSSVYILTWCEKKSTANMDKLQPPSALVLTGNLAENWRRFKQQFQIYKVVSSLARKDVKVRAMTLLHVAKQEVLDVYSTF